MRNPIRFLDGLNIMFTVILIISAIILCRIIPGIKVIFSWFEGGLNLYECSFLLAIVTLIITVTAILIAYLLDKMKSFK